LLFVLSSQTGISGYFSLINSYSSCCSCKPGLSNVDCFWPQLCDVVG